MQQRANQIADEHTNHAATLQQQLDTQYADATPEALGAAKGRLAELRAQAVTLTTLRTALAEASQQADAMSGALRRLHAAEAELAKATSALAGEQALLDSGQKVLANLDDRIAAAEKEIKGNAYDVDLLMRFAKVRIRPRLSAVKSG
jgi:hypothetical protein